MKQDNSKPRKSRRYTDASETMNEIDNIVRGLLSKFREGRPIVGMKQIDEVLSKLKKDLDPQNPRGRE